MADNSPVAHEGNPKEAEITIGVGEVLSTATLGVVLPFVPATPPLVPPPVDVVSMIATCPDVFVWEDTDPTINNDPLPISNNGFAQTGAISRYDARVNVTCSTARDCYGVMWRRVDRYANQYLVPAFNQVRIDVNSIYAEIVFGGVISGAPRVGLCLWFENPIPSGAIGISPSANFINSYGLVADWITGKSYFCIWQGGSLSDLGTVVATIDALPTAGQKFIIEIANSTLAGGGTVNTIDACIGSNCMDQLIDQPYQVPGAAQDNVSHARAHFGVLAIGNPADIRGSANFSGTAGITSKTLYIQADSAQNIT